MSTHDPYTKLKTVGSHPKFRSTSPSDSSNAERTSPRCSRPRIGRPPFPGSWPGVEVDLDVEVDYQSAVLPHGLLQTTQRLLELIGGHGCGRVLHRQKLLPRTRRPYLRRRAWATVGERSQRLDPKSRNGRAMTSFDSLTSTTAMSSIFANSLSKIWVTRKWLRFLLHLLLLHAIKRRVVFLLAPVGLRLVLAYRGELVLLLAAVADWLVPFQQPDPAPHPSYRFSFRQLNGVTV